jgi:hypothetical protein
MYVSAYLGVLRLFDPVSQRGACRDARESALPQAVVCPRAQDALSDDVRQKRVMRVGNWLVRESAAAQRLLSWFAIWERLANALLQEVDEPFQLGTVLQFEMTWQLSPLGRCGTETWASQEPCSWQGAKHTRLLPETRPHK